MVPSLTARVGICPLASHLLLNAEAKKVICVAFEITALYLPKILKVKKGIVDYSMGQITQIVESNNGKLLGLFISESDGNSIEVTMKISLGAINEIIQTFRRYNYEIISEHQEDDYINTLKERSDYLDKYLNM